MKKSALLLPVLISLVFTPLFYRQQAGLNVLLFNLLLLALLVGFKRLSLHNRMQTIFGSGALLSAAMTAVFGESAALFANVLSLILLAGAVSYPAMVVPLNGFIAAGISLLTGPITWLKQLGSLGNERSKTAGFFRLLTLIVVPLIVLIVFIMIYSAASPFFQKFTGNIAMWFSEWINRLFEWINPAIFFLSLAGLLFGMIFFFGKHFSRLTLFNEDRGEVLVRHRKPFSGRNTALKTEFRSGVILLVLLNLALGVMNVLDLIHVWVNFEWDGGYLKQFVHEGTWLLIWSILISIAIVLWLFRGNLNFYSRHRILVILSGIWLAQNAFLALSVAVRNMWYIHYFNLAFKRIWVFVFLIVVLYGLYTVTVKLRRRRTFQYLLIRNTLFAFAMIVLTGFFNWDAIIARYNVKHAGQAFFHTDFMMYLDSSTLPYLHLDTAILRKIDSVNKSGFPDHRYYASVQIFQKHIRERSRNFKKGYPRLDWVALNISDVITYRKLSRLPEAADPDQDAKLKK